MRQVGFSLLEYIEMHGQQNKTKQKKRPAAIESRMREFLFVFFVPELFRGGISNAGRSHKIKTGNSSFDWVQDFKYLGTNVKNRNSIQEEIKSR